MIIDSHQHFWNPHRGDYGWMPPDDPILSKTYGPEDILPSLKKHSVNKTVLVQAAPTLYETEYLLGIADSVEFVAGVVGWVDFEQKNSYIHLERLKKHKKFKGLRPMVQDLPDDTWMARTDVQWAFEALSDLDLCFDALGFPRHLEHFLQLLNRHPNMKVVIDHCMKPQIRSHNSKGFLLWKNGMTLIAKETSAYCKFSALITEANSNWTVEDLRPYVDHILNVFGPERVMWGSDWPVCLLRGSYSQWFDAAHILTNHLSLSDKSKVFGLNAARFYGL